MGMTPESVETTALLRRLDFLPVPAGEAVLGLDDRAAERLIGAYGEYWEQFFMRETPQHNVSVAAFALARYPVTNAIYAQFMAEDGYQDPQFWTPDGWAWRVSTGRIQPLYWNDPHFAGDNRPAVGVSWFEAMAVARWASLKTGRNIHLPGEAEWEWAARRLNTRSNYPWGGAWDPKKLNSGYSDEHHTKYGSTMPVGSFSPAGDAPFGHSDMLGQVWEWTNSLFRPYPYVNGDGRENRYDPSQRVMRGGNWSDGKYTNRVTTRYYYPPYYSDKVNGFRLAADGDQPPIASRLQHDLVVYGRSTFCPDLLKVQHWLYAWNVPYRQLQVDLDEAAAYRLDSWLGSRSAPTIIVAEQGSVEPIRPPDPADLNHLRSTDRGSMLHEPDEATLHAFLVRNGIVTP